MSLSFFLLMSLVAKMDGESSLDEECKALRCSHHGPVVRFPFRLKHQPEHCGYPGFVLSCSDHKRTVVEVPYQGPQLWVRDIDYIKQYIVVRKMGDCLPRQNLNHNITASPFFDYYDISFFSCSEIKEGPFGLFGSIVSFPCNFLSRNPIFGIASGRPLDYNADLSSCSKVFNATLPDYILYDDQSDVYLLTHWPVPECRDCEAKGSACQRKKSTNSTHPLTECVDHYKPAKGKGVPIDKIVLAEVILGILPFTLGIFIIFIVYRSNKLKRDHRINIQNFLEDYRALRPSRYSYAEIKKITSNFMEKLGQGNYGAVYKGKLSNEVFVAVTILDDFKGNGEEFINEVETMSMIHHINIVHLLGFCADGYKRALIYEFLPNGSLDKFIFSTSGNNCSLSWQNLQDIALDIAKGIKYLHQGCDKRILYLDIKPHNILLDHNLYAKISDFGLAKLCSKEQSVVSMTAARGTMGYIAPEMLSRNFGSVFYRSDVFSFAIL